MHPVVKLDTRWITDDDSFHDVFAEVFGFPGFYGRNLNACIDCMSWRDDPSSGMTTVHAPPGGVVTIELEHVDEFAARCPDLYRSLIECSAFVNWRRMQTGEPAVLALAFNKSP